MQFRTTDSLRLLLIVAAVSCAASPACVAQSKNDGDEKRLAQVARRAKQGQTQGQIELAAAYLTGHGVPQNLAAAAYWYRKAAEAGAPGAQNQIGYFYREGIGVQADEDRAFHWFQLASASGLSIAKVNLGVSYFAGHGVREDLARARELFEEAAQKGEGRGAAYLGLMNYLGTGGPVDKAAAERWFEQGTKLRDPVAAFNLAHFYFDDPDHPHDLRRAVDLLRQSSGLGYVSAMHDLAFILVNHSDLAESAEEAPTLLQRASEAGSWKSSLLLGILARKGQQVPKNASRALYCFHLAVLQGGPDAQQALAGDLHWLARVLPADEQARVTAQADAWFAQHRFALTYVAVEGAADGEFPRVSIADPGRYPSGLE